MVAVVGATASGKTDLSLDLAERLGGEIVNTDAMQVYRGMDVGTAKLPAAERRGIPHHLLDVLDIHETASVAQFQGLARTVIDDLRGRGVTPVLVGGSALYTRAVLDRFEFPGTDEVVRRSLEDELAATGPAALHARLAAADPEAAAGILPGNGRRIVRALEVADDHRAAVQRVPAAARLPARERAPGRGRDRPRRPWRSGSPTGSRGCSRPASSAEVEALLRRGWRRPAPRPARSATPRSPRTWPASSPSTEARERTVAATRRFARRQDSWFHKDPRITWVDSDDPERVELAVRSAAPLSKVLKSRVGARETPGRRLDEVRLLHHAEGVHDARAVEAVELRRPDARGGELGVAALLEVLLHATRGQAWSMAVVAINALTSSGAMVSPCFLSASLWPWALTASAATPVACGEAIEVPCRNW